MESLKENRGPSPLAERNMNQPTTKSISRALRSASPESTASGCAVELDEMTVNLIRENEAMLKRLSDAKVREKEWEQERAKLHDTVAAKERKVFELEKKVDSLSEHAGPTERQLMERITELERDLAEKTDTIARGDSARRYGMSDKDAAAAYEQATQELDQVLRTCRCTLDMFVKHISRPSASYTAADGIAKGRAELEKIRSTIPRAVSASAGGAADGHAEYSTATRCRDLLHAALRMLADSSEDNLNLRQQHLSMS